MKRIGLLSDTHGWLDPKLTDFFQDCDEVWHCGDMGDVAVADALAARFRLRAVYGNIDGGVLRQMFRETEVFECEGVKVVMTHIGGYPGKYDPRARRLIDDLRPDIFVCGHSHILKVVRDTRRNMLVINPGAAGIQGFHIVRTALRFHIDDGRIHDMEVFEVDR